MIGPKRWRGLAFALTVLLALTANAATEIHSLTGTIEGHQVGGVTIDLIGNVYVADFADGVWKITPEGERQLFATGLYGASGNVIDNDGSLLQMIGESEASIPRRAIVRRVDLEPPKQTEAPAEKTCCTVFELRQYTLRPGQRDTLIQLFDREFVEAQEALGMRIEGQFRDLDNPDHFVWARGFPNMEVRLQGLTSFYGGPIWKAHSRQANATMIDTDNVLLLHPVDPRGGFNDLPTERPPPDATTTPSTLVVATIYNLRAGSEQAFSEFFRGSLRPALLEAGITPRAAFATEHSPNTFPGLPVRADANVFVWFASYASDAAYLEQSSRLSKSRSWAKLRSKLASYLTSPTQDLRLRPTARSLLR